MRLVFLAKTDTMSHRWRRLTFSELTCPAMPAHPYPLQSVCVASRWNSIYYVRHMFAKYLALPKCRSHGPNRAGFLRFRARKLHSVVVTRLSAPERQKREVDYLESTRSLRAVLYRLDGLGGDRENYQGLSPIQDRLRLGSITSVFKAALNAFFPGYLLRRCHVWTYQAYITRLRSSHSSVPSWSSIPWDPGFTQRRLRKHGSHGVS